MTIVLTFLNAIIFDFNKFLLIASVKNYFKSYVNCGK